jgi:hypothetical protein
VREDFFSVPAGQLAQGIFMSTIVPLIIEIINIIVEKQGMRTRTRLGKILKFCEGRLFGVLKEF